MKEMSASVGFFLIILLLLAGYGFIHAGQDIDAYLQGKEVICTMQ
ncbi:MAG TPA: hypothetical protein VJI70_03895 [Candidatus Paceibacterota bacterium]